MVIEPMKLSARNSKLSRAGGTLDTGATMPEQLIAQFVVDPERVPWKRSATEGIAFGCQVLLGGEGGGPEALRFRFDPCPSVYAHMHLTAQFQVLLGGGMNMPRGAMNLRPVAVHYTDHNTPYGPFSALEGHDMLVLHPKQGGLISMAHLEARRQINLGGRLLVAALEAGRWRPDAAGIRTQDLIPREMGPAVRAVELPAQGTLRCAEAPFGRYEVVLAGAAGFGGPLLAPPAFRYVRGVRGVRGSAPLPIEAGAQGATLLLLEFDADALEGGLTGEGIALTAAESMSRAI